MGVDAAAGRGIWHARYGQYKPQKPISDRLKVATDTNKPKNSREQRSKFDPQPLRNIKRGDRSQTLWARRKQLKDSIATVETSSLYEPDELWFENPEATDDSDEAVL